MTPRQLAALSDEQLFALDTEVLDRAAFSVAQGDEIEIPLNEVHVIHDGDYSDAVEDVRECSRRSRRRRR